MGSPQTNRAVSSYQVLLGGGWGGGHFGCTWLCVYGSLLMGLWGPCVALGIKLGQAPCVQGQGPHPGPGHPAPDLVFLQIIGFGSALLEEVDPNPANFVGAGIIHTRTTQIGCLLRLEPNLQAQVSSWELAWGACVGRVGRAPGLPRGCCPVPPTLHPGTTLLHPRVEPFHHPSPVPAALALVSVSGVPSARQRCCPAWECLGLLRPGCARGPMFAGAFPAAAPGGSPGHSYALSHGLQPAAVRLVLLRRGPACGRALRPRPLQVYRLTLRASKESVSQRLCELLAQQF